MKGAEESQLLLGFYGDDFSGSIDVMEALALAGVRTLLLLRPPDAERTETVPMARRVVDSLRSGRSVVVHTALGPEDARIEEARALFVRAGRERQHDRSLGLTLAAAVRAAVEQAGVRRLAVAGGDTAGYVTRALGIDALSFVAPIAPGSPLCRIHADSARRLDGLEITFKGGQVGQTDFFERVLRGTTPEPNGKE